MKPFEQWGQWKRRSLLWIRLCRVRLELREKRRGQEGQGNTSEEPHTAEEDVGDRNTTGVDEEAEGEAEEAEDPEEGEVGLEGEAEEGRGLADVEMCRAGRGFFDLLCAFGGRGVGGGGRGESGRRPRWPPLSELFRLVAFRFPPPASPSPLPPLPLPWDSCSASASF